MSSSIPLDVESSLLPAIYKPAPTGYDEPEWPRCTEKHTKDFLAQFAKFWAQLTTVSSASQLTPRRSRQLLPSSLSPLVSIGLNEATRSLEMGTAKLFVICVPQVIYRAYFPFVPFLAALLGTHVVTLMCSSKDLGKVFGRKTVQAFSINLWPQASSESTPAHIHLKDRMEQLWAIMTADLPAGAEPPATPALLRPPAALEQAIESIPSDAFASLSALVDSMCQMGTVFDIIWVKSQQRPLLLHHFSDLFERLLPFLTQTPATQGRIRKQPPQDGTETTTKATAAGSEPCPAPTQPAKKTKPNSHPKEGAADVVALSKPSSSLSGAQTTAGLPVSTEMGLGSEQKKPKRDKKPESAPAPAAAAPTNPFADLGGGVNPFGAGGNPFGTAHLDHNKPKVTSGLAKQQPKTKIQETETAGGDAKTVAVAPKQSKKHSVPAKPDTAKTNSKEQGKEVDAKSKLSAILGAAPPAPKSSLSSLGASMGIAPKSPGLSLSAMSSSIKPGAKSLSISDILNKNKK